MNQIFSLKLLFGLLSTGLLIFILRQVRRGKLDLRHGILWIPVALGALFFSAFPGALEWVAHFLGFQIASNAAMSLGIMGLLFVTFLQSIAIARAKSDVRRLAQKIAFLEADRR